MIQKKQFAVSQVIWTDQLAVWKTFRLDNSLKRLTEWHLRATVIGIRVTNSLTHQLTVSEVTDWSTRGMDNSHTSQLSNCLIENLAYIIALWVISKAAVGELTSPRFFQSASHLVSELNSAQLDWQQVALFTNRPWLPYYKGIGNQKSTHSRQKNAREAEN